MSMFKSVVTTGKFVWLTYLDVRFLNHARSLGDDLSVILYNDHRVNIGMTNRGRRADSRIRQLEALDCVDSVTISMHGQFFRYDPHTEWEEDDLSVGYELEQCRPHLFVTHQQKVWLHNEDACEKLGISMQFIPMEDYFPNE